MYRNVIVGERVVVRYKKKLAHLWPYHGQHGTVLVVSKGPGPLNTLVRLDSGVEAIFSKWHLIEEEVNYDHGFGQDAHTGEPFEPDKWCYGYYNRGQSITSHYGYHPTQRPQV